jgi:hypothetical protein
VPELFVLGLNGPLIGEKPSGQGPTAFLEKTPIFPALQASNSQDTLSDPGNQLILFD